LQNEYEVQKELNADCTLTRFGSTKECSQEQKASDRAEYSPRPVSQGSKRSHKYETGTHESRETYAPKDQVHCAVKGDAGRRAYWVGDKRSDTYLAKSKNSK